MTASNYVNKVRKTNFFVVVTTLKFVVLSIVVMQYAKGLSTLRSTKATTRLRAAASANLTTIT
jgi:hypothetical protein